MKKRMGKEQRVEGRSPTRPPVVSPKLWLG